jgi:protein-S-isoprenylcysteine O-methyltransferase Ste14
MRCSAARPSRPCVSCPLKGPPAERPPTVRLTDRQREIVEAVDDVARGNWLLVGQAACEISMFLPGRRLWRGRLPNIAIGGGLIVAGLGLGGSAAWALGRQVRLHPTPPAGAVLRTKGPYRHMRHPMYLGMLLAAAGVALLRARSTSVVALAGMITVLSTKATVEERALLTRFPAAYGEYCRVTPRCLPPTPWLPGR